MIPVRQLLAGICLLLGYSAASYGVDLPLNGAAPYKELGKEKFLAALYLKTPSPSPTTIFSTSTNKRMELRLTSRYSKRRWVNLWMQGMAINNSSSEFNRMANALVEMFATQKAGVKPNDVVAINYSPESGCSYEINGVELARGQPADLFNLFLSAWIGKVPPSSGFRDAILGNSDLGVQLVRLGEITPSEERIADIEAWLVPDDPEPEAEPETESAEVATTETSESPAATEVVATEPVIEIPIQISPFAEEKESPLLTAIATSTQLLLQQEEEAEEQTVSVEMILAMKEYTKKALHQVYKSIKYPSTALRRGHQGQVRLLIQVNRSGELLSVEAAEECDHKSLNKAAQKAVKKAAPFAMIPSVITDDPLEITIPISFRLE